MLYANKNKNKNNCKVSCLETRLSRRYKENYVTQNSPKKVSGLSRNGPHGYSDWKSLQKIEDLNLVSNNKMTMIVIFFICLLNKLLSMKHQCTFQQLCIRNKKYFQEGEILITTKPEGPKHRPLTYTGKDFLGILCSRNGHNQFACYSSREHHKRCTEKHL